MEILEVMRRMLRFLDNYYVGDEIKNPEKIIEKLESGKPVWGIYLLTLSGNRKNLMEILPASMLMQKSFREICPAIFGMAKGKENAIEMAAAMLGDMYRSTGGFAVEEYMKNR